MSINIIVIVSLLVIALLGYLLGFGKSLKITTKGIIGIIISVAVCFMLGGTIKNIPFVAKLIIKLDLKLTDMWSFLGKIHAVNVAYYVCLFIVIQIARIIIVKIICTITEINGIGMKIINRVLGAVFLPAFFFALCLLSLAILKTVETTSFALNIFEKIHDSFLMDLYLHNPIVL